MTINELEMGLCRLNQRQAGDFAFWDENIVAFRRTALFAIRETSQMLATGSLPLSSWIELKRQMVRLRSCLALADNYLRSRGRNPHADLPVRN